MALDKGFLDRVVPEPPTEQERYWRDQIGQGEISLWITKIELMCGEAKDVLVRTGLSPAIQAMDCVVGLYTARGDLCLASTGTYIHVCTGPIPCKYVVESFTGDPTVGVHDGDIFFANELLYGGFHNPDQLNLLPIFYQGELIAWAIAASHEPETGGAEPGGYAPNARSRYEEGLKAPPIKIGARFELKSDMMGFIANMVRDERVLLADVRARAAACMRLRQRVLEVVVERGPGFLIGLMRRIIDDSGRAARERLAMFHDGTYRAVRFYDERGNVEGMGAVHVALHKRGDEMIVDLSGSSPPTRTYLNSKPHVLRGLFLGELMMYLFADLPTSGGLMAPFKFEVPEGTLVNAPDDYAMSGAMRVTGFTVNAMSLAVAKMIFSNEALRERACVPQAYSAPVISGGGIDQYGQVFSQLNAGMVNACGASAGPRGRGMDAAQFWFSGVADSCDVEHEEVQQPLHYLYRQIMRDGGGAGKFRGGSGMSAAFIYRNAQSPVRLVYGTRTTRFPSDSGLMGGYGVSPLPFLTLHDTRWDRVFLSPDQAMPSSYYDLLASDSVHTTASYRAPQTFANGEGTATASYGSAGYGDPLEADPREVVADVATAIVSRWVAENVYNVVYDERSREGIDEVATQALRQRTRSRRLREGRSFDEFEREWLARKPSQDILSLYGPWPMGIV